MIDDSEQLGLFLRGEARRLGIGLAFDTHYDASNWLLSWRHRGDRFRLDFQPLHERTLILTRHRDRNAWIPRAIAELLRLVGPLAAWVTIDWELIGQCDYPIDEERVRSIIDTCLASSRR